MLATNLLIPIPWWNIVLRLGIVLLVSTIIGFSQPLRAKLVGLRVYMLVSLGSAFFVLVPLQLGIFQSRPALLGLVIEGIITSVSAIATGMSFSSLRQPRAVRAQTLEEMVENMDSRSLTSVLQAIAGNLSLRLNESVLEQEAS